MAASPFFLSLPAKLVCFLAFSLVTHSVQAFVSSTYVLDSEYQGANFYDGWDFYTGQDPTSGFVTYYSQSSAQLTGLINASDTSPAYMGVDYVSKLPVDSAGQADGAGRPSVRITSKRSWTHGLFIGDFSHAPSFICGTWPAFWTLGPNWPYTGEIDIMEGVNQIVSNAVALHTNDTCTIDSNSTSQLGQLGNDNCAYHPNGNIGCGVVDPRPASYSDFNSVGGGVYAMQWTSEYIRVWFFPRDHIPEDITNKEPNPSGWGLPAANMMGDCSIDQHFQQHNIVFDTTFCGEYAGSPNVWNSNINSCAAETGYATCDAYVANRPEDFRDAYWSINYVRVYQLVDTASPTKEPGYIASLQSPSPVYTTQSSTTQATTPTVSLCPTYNFTTIANGDLTYEVMCDYDLSGPALPSPYDKYQMDTLEDCLVACTYINTHVGANVCGAVAYDESRQTCYFYSYVDRAPTYQPGFAGARLIYYGYPQITDDLRSQPVESTSFVETIPTPETYRPPSTTSATINPYTSFSTTSISIPTSVAPPQGTTTTMTANTTLVDQFSTTSYSKSVSSSREGTISMFNSESISGIIAISSSTRSYQPVTTKVSNDSVPSAVADFKYEGCMSVEYSRNSFVLSETSPNLTISRCIASCSSSYYAGLYGNACYCSSSSLSDHALTRYLDSQCNIQCPGNPAQTCGGVLSSNSTDPIQKRELDSPAFGLLTLYVNTLLQVTITVSSTSTQILTVTILPISGTHSVVSDVTATNVVTVTAISTTWCDYCDLCADHQTTLTTTITVPCPLRQSSLTTVAADVSIPTVPMTTSTRCGTANGAAYTTTVTVPCESSIAILKNSANRIIAAQASASAAVSILPSPISSVGSVDVNAVASVTQSVMRPEANATTTYTVQPMPQGASTGNSLSISMAGTQGNATNFTMSVPVPPLASTLNGLLPTAYTSSGVSVVVGRCGTLWIWSWGSTVTAVVLLLVGRWS